MNAKVYALSCHQDTNHFYDFTRQYGFHLEMVVETAKKFFHLIPEKEQENVLAACWCHDVIEDCRQTYNDVKAATNEQVADIVYALTNEKGKTRAERANDKYYEGIRNTPFATFVKVCDRIANMEYSIVSGNGMLEKYREEQSMFRGHLYDEKYDEIFLYLSKL